METQRRGTSHSAPYGHACMSCFKAKCRCIPRLDGNGCERCHRLKKHCAPSKSIRRRVIDHDPKYDSGGRVSRLEGIVSQLQSRDIPVPQGTVADDLDGLESMLDPSLSAPINDNSRARTATPDPAEALACFDTFRYQMLPHFPFIHLPANQSLDQLQQDRPHLFRAITCVAASTARERQQRAIELKRALFEAAFLQQQAEEHNQFDRVERTMDLLLSLLTYAAWGWDFAHLARLMMLAVSLVGEMHLDRPAPPNMRTMALLIPGAEGWDGIGSEVMTTRHFFKRQERQRAVLACFVLSSVIASYSGQVDAMQLTPQMEEHLAAISTGKGCSNDTTLALHVRLQLLSQKAIYIRDHIHDMGPVAAEGLLIQLQELRPSIPQQQATLLAQASHTELTILETLLSSIPTNPSTTTTPPPLNTNTTNPTPNPTQLNIPSNLTHLYQTLLAIQSCTTTLLSLPLRTFSLAQWTQLARCITALHRLETLHVPDPHWDAAAVRAVVDLPVLLDRMGGKLDGARREVHEGVGEGEGEGNGNGGGVFTRLRAGVEALREEVVHERGRAPLLGGGEEGFQVGYHHGEMERGVPVVVAPQKGYFRNPRFWLNQFWLGVE